MFAIGLEHDACLGLVNKPFDTLFECMQFIAENSLDLSYDRVLVLESVYVCGSCVEKSSQKEVI